MRMTVVVTCVAAVVALPLAVEANGPQMSRSEFLAAVRCVAQQSVGAPRGAFAAVTAIRTAKFNELFTAHRGTSGTTLPGNYFNTCFVYKFHE